MVSPGSGKDFAKHSIVHNADMRRESGTCNVCSAPCSSCMHPKRTLMGSKADEFSDENCHVGEAGHPPMDEDGVTSLRSRACESSQHAVSETSNMLSVNSSHDSLSENADSRRTLLNKFQDSKSLDGLDDNTSSISRASDANLVNGSHLRDSDGTNMFCNTASINRAVAEGSGSAPSFETSNLSETLAFKDVAAGRNSPKVQSPSAQSWSGKSLSSSPGQMDLERDSCSHIPVKLSECSVGNIDSLLTKEAVPIIGSGEKCLADKDSLIVGNADIALKSYPKSEANTDIDVENARDEAHKSSVQDGQDEKTEDLVEDRDMQEPKSEDESDESDVVEHDVKVCDICGDAGREDLLAICSRCSDGAEHTYCMREMLQKVPEGDWLCEECKCAEETDNQNLDEERNTRKVSSTSQVSGKRHAENTEAAPAAKRQALESNIGSPIASSPKRISALSRESSFKNLDKGKVKPNQQMPIRNHSGNDNMECSRSATTGPRVPVPKGFLSKSNSFNTLNSKPRVKLVDEAVPQKQKGAGEHTSKNIETPARMISKSMSFKAVNLIRPNATESKVKLLSSKSIPTLDSKGSRHAKEWGALDRKTLYKSDRPMVSLTMSTTVNSTTKSDQKLTPRTEINKPSSVNTNSRELKVNQDGKSSILSKSSSSLGRKGVEPIVSSEKTSASADETLQDTVPGSRETTNQIEKPRDSSDDQSLSGVNTASQNAFCQKCKEIGHPAESCTLDCTQEPGSEVSSTRSTKEEMQKGNRLRAALRAAMLKRPEIYKKKEIPNQTDELSTSGTDLNCEVTSQDQVLVSNPPNNGISTEMTQVGQKVNKNFSSETAKCSSVNDAKQLNVCPADSCSQPVDSDSIDPSGKPTASELPKQALPVSLVPPKMPIIPEYEYIWQGVFEVHRGGKPPDLCAGIQAHLSTCASPKVLQLANKFPSEVSFNEVPRLSAWPSQFHQGGAKEDHIAVYFFAKDVESYERYYKGLLDHMTRNDLALKGIVDGVELLIFPSNQLPEKSQRWNMLFFLWGVFRGRRMKNSDSGKKICIPSLNVMPDEKDFHAGSLKHVDEESIAFPWKPSTVLASTCPDQGHDTLSRNSDIKESVFDQKHTGSQVYIEKKDSEVGLQEKLEKQDSKIDAKSSLRVLTGSTQLCQEMKSTVPSMKDCQTPQGPDRESKSFPGLMGTSVSSKIVEAKSDSDSSVKSESRIVSPGTREIRATSMTNENNGLEIMNSVGNQSRPKRKPKEDHYIDIEAGFHRDTTFKGASYQESNAKTFEHIDLSDTVMQATVVAPQRMSWNEVNCKLEDGESASKRLRTDLSGNYGCGSSGVRDSFGECFPSLANDFGFCSSVEDKVCEEACDEKIIVEDLGNMERTFFPIDISDKIDPLLGQNSMSQPPDYENHFYDGIPNLELALGGETKPPQKGMLPFFLGAVDGKNSHEKSPDCLAKEPEDDGVSASLSLSLSFPSLNKESVKPVSKAQQHLSDGNHVNTSLLLFGRFADK